jgi:hypothetical protein
VGAVDVRGGGDSLLGFVSCEVLNYAGLEGALAAFGVGLAFESIPHLRYNYKL